VPEEDYATDSSTSIWITDDNTEVGRSTDVAGLSGGGYVYVFSQVTYGGVILGKVSDG
jgi:hypothetical protein